MGGDLSKRKNQLPDPQKVAQNLLSLMGGRDKAFAAFDADFEAISKVWDENTELVGRILRCHLFVEHFMTEYLVMKSPEFDFDEARLSFTQKWALMERNLPHGFSYLTPGIRRPNAIRNRLSHTLKGEISEDDVNVFMGIPLFKSMRVEAAKRFSPAREPSSEPIAILEDFCDTQGLFYIAFLL